MLNYQINNVVNNPAKIKKYVLIAYCLVFIIVYAILPALFIGFSFKDNSYLLPSLTLISCLFVVIGCYLPLKKIKHKKLVLSYSKTVEFVFIVFVIFILIVFATAEKIPFIASLKGASAADIAIYREKFLKAREGWQASLNYINAFLSGALVPYLICVGFPRDYKHKFLLVTIFALYSISFSEKAFFLRIAIPLFFFYYETALNKRIMLLKWLGSVLLILIVMTKLGLGDDSGTTGADAAEEAFFSTKFQATGAINKTIWRIVVIPVVTASDAINVFEDKFNGQYFYGTTTGTVAALFNRPRVQFEREVFGFQFGRDEGDTGSANSVYITTAFVNFGIPGVIIFSLLVGIIMRFFINSGDIALQGMNLLFIYDIFNSNLLPVLLSSGFLLVIIIAKYVKLN
jgi:hypothetical protein